jgi:hypothetical protein
MPRGTLETIIVVLLILWLLGWLAYPIGGSLIHLLLVLILFVVLIRVLQGRRALP